MCREAKDRYYEDKGKEIDMLDIAHSQLLYQKLRTSDQEEADQCKLLKASRDRA